MNKYDPPTTRDKNDYIIAATKAAIGSIPIVGAAANELLGILVSPSLEKRKHEWMVNVGSGLLEVENKIASLASLQLKESFIDVAIEASRIAISTSQEEIRVALKNAVVNSAINATPDQAKQKMFLHFLDTFTEWHIGVIELFDDPQHYMQAHDITFGNISMGGITYLLEAAFPALKGEKEFVEAIWNDIYSRKLFSIANIHGIMTRDGMITRRTTALGREFLRFIKSPI